MGTQDLKIKPAFIKELSPPGEILYFTSMPKITSHSIECDYDAIRGIGTSGPIYNWKNTGPQRVSISTQLVAQDEGYGIKKKVDWLMSLVYPLCMNGSIWLTKPPIVLVVLGFYCIFKGIVTNVSFEYGETMGIKSLIPLEVKINMTFEFVRDEMREKTKKSDVLGMGFHNITRDEVRKGNLFL